KVVMNRILWVLPLAWILAGAVALGQPARVLIIRHAEKPDDGHCLSVEGWQRAAALVPFFLGELSDECGDPRPGFARPVPIYFQKPTSQNKSRRPLQTVQGLAQTLKLEPRGFAHTDYAEMVRQIQKTSAFQGQTVLICWEHRAIADVARAFGVRDPPNWHGSAFDRVWVIKVN